MKPPRKDPFISEVLPTFVFNSSMQSQPLITILNFPTNNNQSTNSSTYLDLSFPTPSTFYIRKSKISSRTHQSRPHFSQHLSQSSVSKWTIATTIPRKNRAVKPKSEHQSNPRTDPEPEAQLRESQISTQSQSDSYEEDLGPEAQLRESQISTQSCSDSDAVGPEPKAGSPIALIEEVLDLLENEEETLPTYVSPQELAHQAKIDAIEAEWESAPASNDQAAQNYGPRREKSLVTEIQTSRSGDQMELDVEDDPLHVSSSEEPQNPFEDPPMHASQTEAIQSEESDSDASLDLDKGGEPAGLFRDKVSRRISQGSVDHAANPSMRSPGRFDSEHALQNIHSNTESRPESAESARPSPAPKYHKVETTKMVRSETTRIIRGFQQGKIRIETVLKPDPEIHTLREKEEELEDHETMLSNLIDDLMIELKKTRGELKRISRRYRKALADFEKASD